MICLSDIHGNFPSIPDSNLFLFAGDIIPHGMRDLEEQAKLVNDSFVPWVNEIASRMPVVMVLGNHDEVFESKPEAIEPLNPNVHVLFEDGVEVAGFKVWGSPYTRRYGDMAYNRDPERMHWDIPPDTDIIVCHQPPYGCCDKVPNEHVGCPRLRDRILEGKPRLVVCGHIHEGRGIRRLGDTTVINATHISGVPPFSWS